MVDGLGNSMCKGMNSNLGLVWKTKQPEGIQYVRKKGTRKCDNELKEGDYNTGMEADMRPRDSDK
jgi:hypothetical protein